MSVRENWERIREDLKPYPKVTLVAVAKGQPIAQVREIVALGARDIANNYAQEGEKLREGLMGFTGRWHFIGHIQGRKAKDLVGYDCVQSLDRVKVAEALSRHLNEAGLDLDVLIEVNIGREPQKSGVLPEELPGILDQVRKLPRMRVRGLMALPPPLFPVGQRAPFFRELRGLVDKNGLEVLSAGTSDDYSVALAEGADVIRLGTTLFGARVTAPLSNP